MRAVGQTQPGADLDVEKRVKQRGGRLQWTGRNCSSEDEGQGLGRVGPCFTPSTGCRVDPPSSQVRKEALTGPLSG